MTRKTETAKRLRRNQTDAKRVVCLRDRWLDGWKFKRQVPLGRFVVDFLCADARLIIELDGGQHATRGTSDAERTKELETMGYLVLRFWNNDVMSNRDGVLVTIASTLNQFRPVPPHPSPLPNGERERT